MRLNDFGILATSPDDLRLIHEIAKRGSKLFTEHQHYRSLLDIHMDIEVAHKTCPIKLAELLAADDGNFLHDIGGISRHLNRDTGELEDCFLPRYAI